MTLQQYIDELVGSPRDTFDREVSRHEGLRWRAFIGAQTNRDEGFQMDFLKTLMSSVRDDSPDARQRTYLRAWENGTTLDQDDLHAMPLLRAAADLIKTFGVVYGRPEAMEKVRDLFEAAEALIQRFDQLSSEQIKAHSDELFRALLKRYAFLRANYPGLIKDAEIGD